MRYRVLPILYLLCCWHFSVFAQPKSRPLAVLTESVPLNDSAKEGKSKMAKSQKTRYRSARTRTKGFKQFSHRNRRVLGLTISLLLVVGAFIPGLNLVVGALRFLKFGFQFAERIRHERTNRKKNLASRNKHVLWYLGVLFVLIGWVIALMESPCTGFFCIQPSVVVYFLAGIFLFAALVRSLIRVVQSSLPAGYRIVKLPSEQQILKNRLGTSITLISLLPIAVFAISWGFGFLNPVIRLILTGITLLFALLFGKRKARVLNRKMAAASVEPRYQRLRGGPIYDSLSEVPPNIEQGRSEELPRTPARKAPERVPEQRPESAKAQKEILAQKPPEEGPRSRLGELSIIAVVLGLLALIFMLG